MEKIKQFFNDRADNWDTHSIPVDEKMKYILAKTNLSSEKTILDIACGTGVMEKFLLEKNPKSILAVDIAEKMIENARRKYIDDRITFKTCDVLELENQKFDYIIVYNAFPHFLEPEKLLKKVNELLNENGSFVIAHGMGRKDLNDHHKRKASEISLGLASALEVGNMIHSHGFRIEFIEDRQEIYIIHAVKM